MEEARKRAAARGSKTIVFIDEIHRFNKAQQDAFLPYVEAGDIVLIGATTENPSFEVNSALLSRSKVVVIPPLEREQVMTILRRAVEHPDRREVLGIELDDDALDFMAATSAGDARQALTRCNSSSRPRAAEDSPIDLDEGEDDPAAPLADVRQVGRGALQHHLRAPQIAPQRRRRRRRLLARPHAGRGRRPALHRPAARARGVRRHRQRRPAGARLRHRRPADRALPRHAGSGRGAGPTRRPISPPRRNRMPPT